MGMAASQARFLGLTARKTNVEYEGQQVNQQRTTLSNQSANYYNQLLGMTVPTPPSVADYTKTVYTFDDGSLSNSITSLIAQADGSYIVSYTSSWTDDFAAVSAGSSIVTREKVQGTEDFNYFIGSKKLRPLGTITEDDRKNDEYLKTLSDDQIDNLKKEEEEYIKILDNQYGDDSDWVVRYVQNKSTGAWSPYFYKKADLEKAVYSDNGASQSNIPAYTVGSAQKTEEIKGVNARLEQDATGRLISITLNPGDPDEVTYALTTNTITDQAKYDDAMNQYEYNKYQYDQSIQEINAKIEIIQSEDKNLELRLKQLDTEQKAISTEMDAVQKVIEKNTESTFKTFG
ncbi:MAG: hypothetical protein ACLSWI_01375 [Candidatus Gastranaerophilaceae bacterium]